MEKDYLWTIIPFTFGILSIFVYSQIVARREFKLREKGYRPGRYQDKMPQEYSRNQRTLTLIIALYLVVTACVALYFLLNRSLQYANFVIILGLIMWGLIIKIGNRVK